MADCTEPGIVTKLLAAIPGPMYLAVFAGIVTVVSGFYSMKADISTVQLQLLHEKANRESQMGWVKETLTRIEKKLDNEGF